MSTDACVQGGARITRGSYDVTRIAIDAEAEIHRLMAQVDLFWDQELRLYQNAGLKDGSRLLDCGCGPGYVLNKLCSVFPALECTGVELAPELIGAAATVIAPAHRERCRLLEQSVTDMHLPDNTFDFAISRLVLEHLPEPMLALQEMFRVLRPGGKIVVVDNDFALHERTSPDSPALEELYGAYRRARISEGGRPCIGRELPALLNQAGFGELEFHVLAAHSEVLGDESFLKAEGSGIPMRLVKSGFLQPEVMDRVAEQWRAMLEQPQHAIVRILCAAVGEKTEGDGKQTGAAVARALASPGYTAPIAQAEPDLGTLDGLRLFIRETLAAQLEVPAESLPVDESLIQAGVDSLAAAGLCSRLKHRLLISLPITEVLGGNSINELTEKVAALARETGTDAKPIPAQPRKEAGKNRRS